MLDELLALGRVRSLQDGEFVYAKDDQPDGLYGVIGGSARISNIGQDGREAVLAIPAPAAGSVKFHSLMVCRARDTVASGPTELLMIPRTGFHQMLERRPSSTRCSCVCAGVFASLCHARRQRPLPLSSRLAKRLLMHAHNYGQTDDDGRRPCVQLSQGYSNPMLNSSRQSINSC